MINRAQITRRSADDEVSARTVERDYMLAHIVAAVSSIQEESGLIIKGGTALRLCYFEDYRYSADLESDLARIWLAVATWMVLAGCVIKSCSSSAVR